MLSRAADLNIQEISEIFLWFKKRIWIFDLSDPPSPLAQQTAERASNDPEFKARALALIRDADLGLDDFQVGESNIAVLLGDRRHDWKRYRVTTLHHTNGDGSPVSFSLDADESNGTRRLFALAGPILDALDQGATLVLDELECSIHPLLARKIIELFQSPHVNQKGAQLIFATHDSTLMSRDLFRRDQVWLTSKTSSGATELFSLYDIEDRPRNTEALQKNYLDGRYGGVPRFGPIFEDLAFHES